MPSASGIRAGKAYVEVGTDNAPLASGLKSALGMIKGFGSAAAIAGVAGAAFQLGAGAVGLLTDGISAAVNAVPNMVSQFLSTGDALDKMSARTGASVESLSALSYAAGQAGSSGEAVEKGLRKMQQTLDDAAGGSKTANDSLARLGLTVADLKGLSPDEQFSRMADGIQAIRDPAQRTAVAMKIFGDSGADLIPLLKDGSAGLATMRQRAEEVGAVMSGEDASAAATLGDTIDDLKQTFASLGNNIAAELAPILTDVVDIFRLGIKVVRDFVAENRGALQTVSEVVSGIRDALSKGDFAGAFEVAWNGVKVVLLEAADWFWSNWGQRIIAASVEIWAGFQKAAAEAFGWVQKKLLDLTHLAAEVAIDLDPTITDKGLAKSALAGIGVAQKAAIDSQVEEEKKQIDARKPLLDAIAGAFGAAFGDGIRDELDAARRDLDDALERARKGANRLPSIIKPEKLAEVNEQVAGGLTSFGTFGSNFLSQIGPSQQHAKSTADNTKKAADFTEKAFEELERLNSKAGALVYT